MSLPRRTFTKQFKEGAIRRHRDWALAPSRRWPLYEKPTFRAESARGTIDDPIITGGMGIYR
jgi:hypothetical protein